MSAHEIDREMGIIPQAATELDRRMPEYPIVGKVKMKAVLAGIQEQRGLSVKTVDIQPDPNDEFADDEAVLFLDDNNVSAVPEATYLVKALVPHLEGNRRVMEQERVAAVLVGQDDRFSTRLYFDVDKKPKLEVIIFRDEPAVFGLDNNQSLTIREEDGTFSPAEKWERDAFLAHLENDTQRAKVVVFIPRRPNKPH